MIPNVISATPLEPYRIHLSFDDGAEGTIDLTAQVDFTGVFEPVQDPSFFAQLRVDSEIGTIVWPNGADLDPLVLHAAVTGHAVDIAPAAPRSV